ncbi:PREDICTED: 39S ribosomal protein L54, mitochondrial [Crocodylus porosus]|uniref:39S ribosomal protein L54, mitochondrial n=1 Tax=Crocodylus porosus TaxID=8502 RepID=UPI0009390D66|nr:PREDICTED: 39S ribosomal protein L54, mitochondrial [Crocodylus porosus]
MAALARAAWVRAGAVFPLTPLASAGAKAKAKGAAQEPLQRPEVCADPAVLATHAVGVNYRKEGAEVALKDDADYPEWLFQMYIGPPKKLEELDPETPEYWRLLQRLNTQHRNKLRKNRKF